MNYNVSTETIIRYAYLESVDALVINDANQWYHHLKAILPNGCQAVVEIEDLDNGQIDYHNGMILTPPTRSGHISGGFAQAKMDTLKKFPKIAMTGTWNMDELIEAIHSVRSGYDASVFSRLEKTCQLTRELQEELRREIGITTYLGGIRVPFTRLISSAEYGGRKTENKEARISFSALSEDDDLNMCFHIFRGLQQALQVAEPNVIYHFDLSALKQYPTAHFKIIMKGIVENVDK